MNEEKTTTDSVATQTSGEGDANQFAHRGLRPSILEAIEKKGYATATPIQALTFKHFGDGHHIVGESQTGSGKTAAFLVPILNVINLKEAAPQVLILAPTRELALQTEEEAFELTRGLFGAKTALVCGGLSFRNQIQRINRGANVIIGTPGRILSMIEKQIISTNQIKYLVLDEVDRMLDMGFIDEVEAIWSKLPKQLRALCFSATMPYEVKELFNRYLPEGYQHIQIEKKQIVVDQLDHAFIRLHEAQKLPYLESYIRDGDFQKVIAFAQTKKDVMTLQHILRVEGYQVFGLHGDVDQYERINAMKAFKAATKVIMVATDVASRGLNLNDVDLVVNYDMPQDPEDYVHRVGRTARAGQPGKAIMFVSPSEDRKLTQLERANKIQIKEVDIHGNVIPRPQQQNRGPYRGGGGRRRQPRGGAHSGGGRPSYGRPHGRNNSSYASHTHAGHGDQRPRSEQHTGQYASRPNTGSQYSNRPSTGGGQYAGRSNNRPYREGGQRSEGARSTGGSGYNRGGERGPRKFDRSRGGESRRQGGER